MDWIDFETGKVYDTYNELATIREERSEKRGNKNK